MFTRGEVGARHSQPIYCQTVLGRGDDTVVNPHRAQISEFELFEPILSLKLDKQFPVEQFEATVSRSTVPSPPLKHLAPLCAPGRAGRRGVSRVTSGRIYVLCEDLTIIVPAMISNKNPEFQAHVEFHPSGKIIIC